MTELIVQGTGAEDNWIQEQTPTANQGSNAEQLVRSWSTGDIRCLLKFDISSIPAGSTIDSAIMSMYHNRSQDASPTGRTYECNRLTEIGWVELESTWNNYKTSTAWATAGGDFTVTDQATDIVPADGNWMDWNVQAQLQHAIDNTISDAHFLVKDQTENRSGASSAVFYTNDEVTFTTLRPKLVVNYTAPEPPPDSDKAQQAISVFQNPVIPRLERPKTNPGWFDVAGLNVQVPIKIDKWEHVKNYPVREIKRNKANKGWFALVEFNVPTLPEVIMDSWFQQQQLARIKKRGNPNSHVDIDFIEAIQEQDGNFFDTGVVAFSFDHQHVEAVQFADVGTIDFDILGQHVEDFQLEESEAIEFNIRYPDVGVETFNSGVPGFVSASVVIDGVNESAMIKGVISVTREDNTAARFSVSLELDQSISPQRRPIELINKSVQISFGASDMDGVVNDSVPIFNGIVKRVTFNDDIETMNLNGYDHGGVHQTKGEFVSDDITSVFTGRIYVSTNGTFSTGFSPVWGIEFEGSNLVEDSKDYFVNTLTGEIIVPVSSKILQFPGSFKFNYMNPFSDMKTLIQAIVTKKGWFLSEDNVAIADYSSDKEHPVLSLSDESVVDVCRKFLELSGAKVETNLFPTLRVYSEVENFVAPVDTLVVDEGIIFGNTLIYDIVFDNLLNEQTVRSVQKVNANIDISASQTLAQYEGSTGTFSPFEFDQGNNIDSIDYNTKQVLVEKRLRRNGINTISFSASGTFSLPFAYNAFSAPITDSDWSFFVDGDDFVIQLKHAPVTAGGAEGFSGFFSGISTIFGFPGTDFSLTVTGTKIAYGDGAIEDIKSVTAQRPVGGISETLKGDVYENAYIETEQHCTNCATAILFEHGNTHTARFEMPLFEGKTAQIGQRIEIKKDGAPRFYGIIKSLIYNINLINGENSLSVSARGVGQGI